FAAPADANRAAAHETFDSRRIERVDQKLHVLIELVVMAQVSGKSAYWKIRQRIQSVEHNPEMLLQFAFVISLELVLRRRQKRGNWVVNQMQRQLRINSVA